MRCVPWDLSRPWGLMAVPQAHAGSTARRSTKGPSVPSGWDGFGGFPWNFRAWLGAQLWESDTLDSGPAVQSWAYYPTF